ncbi:MAG: YebC/PmpR family DNA-binding transcriptional regulator [Methylococcales bacterium]|nr:YebC/PmpR family DNA-binding transcriptional regulator [Methylococcales bacterium]MBT3506898.1 YebC/PmpR family DNA-binding transcriptional regulator [Methylococcales bacterium]MBT3699816.1 YebC/PmpR family DNA-binding transcriptional regulator [Methylococcales bacterium]MBT3815921.1 YebC/PmpR family DNA-binding transcriptional regulator [Methylococcales bacterium]MBT4032167.1 YebC/PmpR family DNA-binding transcriptional regulator [Methylococcales bacterium]
MAGHSKWANIRHRKGAQDAKRGKLFTKLIREIFVAAKKGADPVNNPSLRSAIDKALTANMKRDTVETTIKKASGSQDGVNYDEVLYEGYGPGGTAVMVECLTDNRNRTVAEVRHAFSKAGGNLGTDGSVAYLFNKVGVLSYSDSVDEDAVMEAALDAGADDVVSHEDGTLDVVTTPEDYFSVKEAMTEAQLIPEASEVTRQATTATVLDVKTAEQMLRLIDRLEDLDDVQNVFSNADISEEVMAQLN